MNKNYNLRTVIGSYAVRCVESVARPLVYRGRKAHSHPLGFLVGAIKYLPQLGIIIDSNPEYQVVYKNVRRDLKESAKCGDVNCFPLVETEKGRLLILPQVVEKTQVCPILVKPNSITHGSLKPLETLAGSRL